MTLCIAWKRGEIIHLASDSRISTDDDDYTDIGIKVIKIPLVIYSPTSSETRQTSTLYDYKIGMCFSGSTSNAYLIKETLYEILQNLQYVGLFKEFSFKSVAELVKVFFEHTTNEIFLGLNIEPETELILAGYCPKEKSLRAFRFETNLIKGKYEIMLDEVLFESGEYELLGDEIDKTINLIDKLGDNISNIDYLEVLCNIIKDQEIKSVGGNLQYGYFNRLNFQITGIVDYKIKKPGLAHPIRVLRGTQLSDDKFSMDNLGFHIKYPFINPFEKKIMNLIKKRLKN